MHSTGKSLLNLISPFLFKNINYLQIEHSNIYLILEFYLMINKK